MRCILAQSFCSKTYVEYAVVGFIRAVVGLPLWVPCYSKKTLLRTQTSCALGQGQLPSTETFNGGSVLNPPPYYLRCPLCTPPGAADALPPPLPPPPPTHPPSVYGLLHIILVNYCTAALVNYREGCRSAEWDFSPCIVATTGAGLRDCRGIRHPNQASHRRYLG